MKSKSFKSLFHAAALGFALTLNCQAQVLLSENFDGGGVNSVYGLVRSGDVGTDAIVTNAGGGAGGVHANVLRITNNTNSNINGAAWNAVNVPASTPILRLSLEFWMGADGSANGSGTAADGFGIGFFPTAVYGSTGGINASLPVGPAPGFAWERPNAGTGLQSLALGADIYPGTSATDGNHVNLWWNGVQLGNVDPGFTLNNGQWHRLSLTIVDQGANSQLLVDIVRDIHGANVTSNLMNVTGTGIDLANIGSNYRLAGGGRTGGENHVGQWDNISVQSIPEPGVFAVLALSGMALILRRRRL